MKKQPIHFSAFKTIIFLFLSLSILSCKKDNEEVNNDLVIDEVFSHNYSGSLSVNFTNEMPQFSVGEAMAVTVNTFGLISFDSGTLDYYGETEVSDDSKIERSGRWQMSPTGNIITEGGVNYMTVDAHIYIEFDETKVYARDNYGNWIMVSEFAVAGTPNSELTFNFDEAVNGGTTAGVNDPYGSITWTLTLSIAD